MFEVSVQQTFAAAHALRGYKGKCENLHGHNYRVEVTVEGEKLDETGLLADFVDIKLAMKSVVDRLDHTNPNEIPPFDARNPSAENIAYYFATEVQKQLPHEVRISAVKVWETETSLAVYRPPLA
jgi:6-pyruvoyltetrahydropterin/6-carboxytetrahydropterin synthase